MKWLKIHSADKNRCRPVKTMERTVMLRAICAVAPVWATDCLHTIYALFNRELYCILITQFPSGTLHQSERN
jgi:hypothetical protein